MAGPDSDRRPPIQQQLGSAEVAGQQLVQGEHGLPGEAGQPEDIVLRWSTCSDRGWAEEVMVIAHDGRATHTLVMLGIPPDEDWLNVFKPIDSPPADSPVGSRV